MGCYIQNGKDFCLSMPFTPTELSSLVNEITDPRRLRKYERVNIPNVITQLHLDSGDLEGDIVNISENGILCDVTNKEGLNNVLSDMNMSIFFPMKYDHMVIHNVWCKLLRIVVLSWGAQNVPERLRIVWQFVDIEDNQANKLKIVVNQAIKEQVIKNK